MNRQRIKASAIPSKLDPGITEAIERERNPIKLNPSQNQPPSMGNLSFSISSLFLATTMLVFLSGVTIQAHLLGGGGGHHVGGGGGGLCKGATYKALCQAILKPGVHGAASATNAAITAAILHTSQAKSMAAKLAPAAGSSYMKSSLSTCVEVYDDAINELMTSMQNVKSRDIPTLKENLSAAMSDYDACDEGFMELPGGICPMDNELLRHFVSNCLALAELIHVHPKV